MIDKNKLYFCDGKKDCQMSPFCGVNNRDTDDMSCFHTTDYTHAKNRGKEMRFEYQNGLLVENESGRIFYELEEVE